MGSIRRGEIVRVRLDPGVGSEQAGERPALVISPDIMNEYSPVVIVAAITSRKTERVYPFEALIEPPEGGLTIRSKVMLSQLRTIDKTRILTAYGALEGPTMEAVDDALAIAVGLTEI
ncbi:MAG: type II toxin-antitoxin system PemK/MazF family toxin [Fimbriimonadaceae bacterium]|nr:type II toxin-antitoxin system PemK/MazF family toxin [Fimbriimonadaceae bacterium]